MQVATARPGHIRSLERIVGGNRLHPSVKRKPTTCLGAYALGQLGPIDGAGDYWKRLLNIANMLESLSAIFLTLRTGPAPPYWNTAVSPMMSHDYTF